MFQPLLRLSFRRDWVEDRSRYGHGLVSHAVAEGVEGYVREWDSMVLEVEEVRMWTESASSFLI